VNIWCGIVGNLLIGPFGLEGRLTGVLYRQEEVPQILEDLRLEVGQGDVAAARWRTSFLWDCLSQSIASSFQTTG
jgi:hypothetical protein